MTTTNLKILLHFKYSITWAKTYLVWVKLNILFKYVICRVVRVFQRSHKFLFCKNFYFGVLYISFLWMSWNHKRISETVAPTTSVVVPTLFCASALSYCTTQSICMYTIHSVNNELLFSRRKFQPLSISSIALYLQDVIQANSE